ncbi:MAG: hypothetical protein WC005_02950 [Candidatus Nanopelagicales bacterium]
MQLEPFINEASPVIGRLGGAFYFTPETLGRGRELGLNGLQWYYIGRGGVLGDAEWPVIASAFGYFSLRMVNKFWNSARAVLAPREGGRLYLECCRDFGRKHYADVEGLSTFCSAAERVIAAVDIEGLALFAGLSSEPLPDDLPGRAQQLLAVLREHRGSVHLLAIVGVGLTAHLADAVRSADNHKLHGYEPEEMPVPTDADRALMVKADELTDQLVAKPYAVLTDVERDAFLKTLQDLDAAAVAE